MYKFVAIASFLLLSMAFAPTSAADPTTTPTPTSLADETRFLYGANSTTVQVSAISVIGATLIGIAIALAIGGILPVFSGAIGGASGFGKRSVPDFDPFNNDQSPFSVFQLLSIIDGFRGFNVADVDCQKKVVCELHRDGASVSGRDLGVLTDKILDVFHYMMPTENEVDGESSSSPALIRQYLDAAKKGKEKEDCERVYSTCEYSIRKVMRRLRNAE